MIKYPISKCDDLIGTSYNYNGETTTVVNRGIDDEFNNKRVVYLSNGEIWGLTEFFDNWQMSTVDNRQELLTQYRNAIAHEDAEIKESRDINIVALHKTRKMLLQLEFGFLEHIKENNYGIKHNKID